MIILITIVQLSLRYFFLDKLIIKCTVCVFHGVSMVLMTLYGSGGDGGVFLVSVQTSMKIYVKPIAEHLLSITLIRSFFLFSSTIQL